MHNWQLRVFDVTFLGPSVAFRSACDTENILITRQSIRHADIRTHARTQTRALLMHGPSLGSSGDRSFVRVSSCCWMRLPLATRTHAAFTMVSVSFVSTVNMLFSCQLSGRPNLRRCAQSLLSFAICGQSVHPKYSCRPAVLSTLWSHGLWSCQHLPPRTEESPHKLVHLNDMHDNVCATVARRCRSLLCGF